MNVLRKTAVRGALVVATGLFALIATAANWKW